MDPSTDPDRSDGGNPEYTAGPDDTLPSARAFAEFAEKKRRTAEARRQFLERWARGWVTLEQREQQWGSDPEGLTWVQDHLRAQRDSLPESDEDLLGAFEVDELEATIEALKAHRRDLRARDVGASAEKAEEPPPQDPILTSKPWRRVAPLEDYLSWAEVIDELKATVEALTADRGSLRARAAGTGAAELETGGRGRSSRSDAEARSVLKSPTDTPDLQSILATMSAEELQATAHRGIAIARERHPKVPGTRPYKANQKRSDESWVSIAVEIHLRHRGGESWEEIYEEHKFFDDDSAPAISTAKNWVTKWLPEVWELALHPPRTTP